MAKKKVSKKKTSKKDSLKKVENKLNKILKYEKAQSKSDKKQSRQEKDVEEDIEKIKKDLEGSPLRKITTKDFGKALIGAFIGVVSHFAFLEGAHLSENLSVTRATALLVTAYILGMIFIYAAGFKKVKQIRILSFIPARITVIYVVSLAVVYFVLFIFGLTEHATSIEIYKQVAAVSIPAIIGASAADLIGER
ncbi:MAG: hypothetical protein CMH62_03580 [Nanoarchaeota archaeon]|nr:hypothetical protein [Nanoarchaeota archaeon]